MVKVYEQFLEAEKQAGNLDASDQLNSLSTLYISKYSQSIQLKDIDNKKKIKDFLKGCFNDESIIDFNRIQNLECFTTANRYLGFVEKYYDKNKSKQDLELKKHKRIFYNKEKGIIGRMLTDSNILERGADNSVYLGSINDVEIKEILETIISNFIPEYYSKKEIEIKGYEHTYKVELDLTESEQRNIKFSSKIRMYTLVESFLQKNNMDEFKKDKYLLLFNFKDKTTFFIERVQIDE